MVAAVKWKSLSPAGVKAVTAAVLVVGLLSALVIYVTARPVPGNPLGEPEDSRKYLRDMEVYGGKANVLAAEVRSWFSGLWHGRNLAFTVAVLTILAALAFLFLAMPLPDEPDAEERGKPRSPQNTR